MWKFDTKIFDRRDASVAMSDLKQVRMYRIGVKSLSVVFVFYSISGTEPFVLSTPCVVFSMGHHLAAMGNTSWKMAVLEKWELFQLNFLTTEGGLCPCMFVVAVVLWCYGVIDINFNKFVDI